MSKLSIYSSRGVLLGRVRVAYLRNFVDPEKEYDVNGVMVKGSDLTDTQILIIFLKEGL